MKQFAQEQPHPHPLARDGAQGDQKCSRARRIPPVAHPGRRRPRPLLRVARGDAGRGKTGGGRGPGRGRAGGLQEVGLTNSHERTWGRAEHEMI